MSVVIGVIAIVGLVYGGILFRKRMRDWFAADDEFAGQGFTLGDLRQLHSAGKLSDAEFASAKAVLLQGLTAGKK